MGGPITLVTKFENNLVKIDGWTGVSSDILFSRAAFENNIPDAIATATRTWADPTDFVPQGYGLTFINFDTKEVHEIQGYDKTGTFSFFRFTMDRSDWDCPIREFIAANRVEYRPEPRAPKEPKFDLEHGIKNPCDYFGKFYLKDWTLKKYPENAEGWKALFQHVTPYLSEEEKNLWEAWIQHREEEDSE
jgi:hypothetical protein